MHRLATLCARCQGAVHDLDVVLRVEEDGSLTALDREGMAVGKPGSAAEVLAEADDDCPLETIVRRELPAAETEPAEIPGSPRYCSLDELPSELSAAEWRALAGRIEWSASQRAFVLHPADDGDLEEIPGPIGEAPAAAPVVRSASSPANFDEFIGQRRAAGNLLLAGRALRPGGSLWGTCSSAVGRASARRRWRGSSPGGGASD
jgi:hypothetical protein